MRKYSFIYEKLVSAENDVVGLIAYGIYKSKKIAFIKKFQEENDGPPKDEELDAFHDISFGHINSYQIEATQILHEFNKEYLADQIENIETDYNTQFENELESFKPNFWMGALQSFIGSVAFAVCVGIFLFVLLWFTKGFWPTVKEVAEPLEKPAIEQPVGNN